ncbi:patatin-like phospholipase family protein [Nocardioides currus]|uniref:Patatin n=1 Tax=Nocardioides currus TaxID=2133958 RepID=A0A2R7YYX1_9ACTN|nr:patatin-like phospholipase family protein [Nocardioides currus]PUA81570.1 patatin [Nocardioides currus]
MSPRTALVLGGGGITGIAWEVGILAGLAAEGVDLTGADRIIGTSAGSVVGVQVTSGTPIADLYDEQLSPPDAELGGRLSRLALIKMVPPFVLPGDGNTKRARIGKLAMKAHEPGSVDREGVIRSRIDTEEWPDRDLQITAVEAETGAFTVFTPDSGVDIVSAVAASCAVPTVWPPVAIDGRHYIDGGMRSTANVDLAAGAERVIVLAPLPQAFSKATSIRAQLEKVAAREWSVITPDAEALAAFGNNLLDPAKRADAARAGLRQAAGLVAEVRHIWGVQP